MTTPIGENGQNKATRIKGGGQQNSEIKNNFL